MAPKKKATAEDTARSRFDAAKKDFMAARDRLTKAEEAHEKARAEALAAQEKYKASRAGLVDSVVGDESNIPSII